MTDADYVTILDKNELNVYNGKITTIKVSKKAVLKGYHANGLDYGACYSKQML